MILIAIFFFVTAIISACTVDEFSDFCRGILFVVSAIIFCLILSYCSNPEAYHKMLDIYWEEIK